MRGVKSRTARTYVTGAVTRSIRRGALVLIGFAVAVLLARYPALPEQIPSHYNFVGEVDAWSGRWSALLLAAVGLVLVGGCTWLSHYPRIFNYPREITEENAQRVYRAGEQMLVWVTASVSLLFTGLLIATAFPDTESGLTLGSFGIVATLIATIAGFVQTLRA